MDIEPSVNSAPVVRPMFFFLPGLFLFLLGLGNVWVGGVKEREYTAVLQELEALAAAQPETKLLHASPLKRVQIALNSAERTYHRREKVLARLNFYEMVIYGGRFFVLVGALFILAAITTRIAVGKTLPRMEEQFS